MSHRRQVTAEAMQRAHANIGAPVAAYRDATEEGESMGDLLGKKQSTEQRAAKGDIVNLIVEIIVSLLGKPEEVRRRYARLIEMAVCPETREAVGKLARIALHVEQPQG